MRKPGTYIQVLFTVLMFLLSACGQVEAPPPSAFDGITMGTTYTVKTVGTGTVSEPELRLGIDHRLQQVDARMSTYKPDSELSRLNASPDTGWIPLSPELYSVIRLALAISGLSGGAFDITVGPLVNLWGFGPGAAGKRVPDAGALAAARARTGYRLLQLADDRPAVRKLRPDIYIDLSGIAKGYGVDVVAAYLESAGIRDYMVEVGGEIRARGVNAGGRPWQIGIERPLTGERSVEQVIPLHDMALATSGDYRNYFEQDGVRYSHTIDPSTGSPVRHALASVSVLDASSARADALATALLVLGPEAGYELAEREHIPALFIIRDAGGFTDKWTPAMQSELAH